LALLTSSLTQGAAEAGWDALHTPKRSAGGKWQALGKMQNTLVPTQWGIFATWHDALQYQGVCCCQHCNCKSCVA